MRDETLHRLIIWTPLFVLLPGNVLVAIIVSTID